MLTRPFTFLFLLTGPKMIFKYFKKKGEPLKWNLNSKVSAVGKNYEMCSSVWIKVLKFSGYFFW